MLATLILGIAAGVLPPHAEPHLKPVLSNLFGAETAVTSLELRMFSFAVCLLLAAFLAYIFGNGSALVLAIGAAIGVFWPRVFSLVQSRRSPDYGED